MTNAEEETEMVKKRFAWMLVLGLSAIPLTFAQGGGAAPSQGNSPQSQSGARSDRSDKGVTTNDSVTDPHSNGQADKKTKGGDKNRKAPKSPPNPPVTNQDQPPADAHENPVSPTNRPKPQ
jgi:hypothetical protein